MRWFKKRRRENRPTRDTVEGFDLGAMPRDASWFEGSRVRYEERRTPTGAIEWIGHRADGSSFVASKTFNIPFDLVDQDDEPTA